MSDAITDQHLLATSAYAGDSHLTARQRLYDHQRPRFDLPGIVSSLVARHVARPTAVLDAGCGNGTHLTRLRQDYPHAKVIGLDVAAGMLTSLAPPVIRADVTHLPLRAESMDVALAMHMLYHLADIPTGIEELARVLSPGGLLIASTNATDDKSELDQLWSQAAGRVLGTNRGPQRLALSSRFRLEDAPERLGHHFTDIEVQHLTGAITVTTPDPVIAHLNSYRSFAKATGVPFEPTVQAAREILTERIAEDGAFQITAHGGVITARRT